MTTKMEISPLLAGCASAGFTTLLFQVIFLSSTLCIRNATQFNLIQTQHVFLAATRSTEDKDARKTRLEDVA